MFIYNLDIQFGYGGIGIDTYKGFIDLTTHIQESFDMKTQSPELSVTNTFPIIEDIDSSHCRTDMGYPQPFVASSMWYNEAKQYVIEYIGSKAAGGDALGAIEKGISIGDIVENESFPEPPEINVDAVPKTPPRITFRYGEIKSDLYRGSVKVNISDKPVTVDHDRARVNIYMEKNPYITIKAVPKGKNIDRIA
ncbi:MAG TPA: hypothetical protein GXZ27_03655 [Thermoanaerobacterales bacterium]|nr:hypothetical protein [Thermoanaerobacterales bacterium]